MPEYPQVESFRKEASKAINKTIKEVEFLDNYQGLLKKPEEVIKKALTNNQIKETHRRGKYLFLDLKSKCLVLHFGMTGDIAYYKEKRPGHVTVNIKLENGYSLGVISVRKFGFVDLVKNYKEFIKDKNLGPEAVELSKEEFRKIIKDSRGYLKTTLMDQKKMAGIGNLIADEMLFQVGIHPERKIKDLSDQEINKLHDNIEKAGNIYFSHGSAIRPTLVDHRKPNAKCPKDGGRIKRIKVGGRSTYFCDKHQK